MKDLFWMFLFACLPMWGTAQNVVVADSADYSPEFLAAIESSGLHSVQLRDSLMYLPEGGPVRFPVDPPIGSYIKLTAREGDLVCALILERVNYTTIQYRLELVEFGEASYHEKGEVHLSPLFFLGSEMDENSYTGNMYPSIEYSTQEGECYTYIRLGRDKGPYLVRLIRNCNGDIRDINLENYPTLIEK